MTGRDGFPCEHDAGPDWRAVANDLAGALRYLFDASGPSVCDDNEGLAAWGVALSTLDDWRALQQNEATG